MSRLTVEETVNGVNGTYRHNRWSGLTQVCLVSVDRVRGVEHLTRRFFVSEVPPPT